LFKLIFIINNSVLENIVGRDFLPRGNGIVTRRPLVLQLYSLGVDGTPAQAPSSPNYPATPNDTTEWGEFLHLPGQRFYDFNEIRAEIQRETERVTGKNKGISSKTINLKIFSPNVLNLTLVDLPGITKVPTGDQPEDVEEQIRAMCYEFISNPNAIILAVTAANSDLANSDGLKMARSVDPDGERTIGVLTKVDIMDHGTDCSDILSNRVVPLRRGYIAVMNRSQKDIQDDVPIRKGIAKESSFFQSHPKYRNMLSKCGTSNLARTLNQILMHHIRDCLPDIKSKIMSMMLNVQTNLDALGEPTDAQGNSRLGATLLSLLSKFALNFSNSVDGRGSMENALEMTELYGGARISYIFNETFGKRLKGLDPFEGLDDEDIRTAIANANGPRPCLFVPEIAFDLLVRRQIARLEQPGLQCVDLVFDEMQRMAFQSETTELSRFPELRDRVYEIVNNLLRSCVSPTQKMISNLIQLELAYINTSHPDFIGGKRAVAQIQNKNLASNTTTSTSTNSSSSSGNGHRGAENHNTSNISDPSPAVKDKSGDGNPPVPPSTSKNGSEGKGLFGLLKGNTAASSSNISQGFVKDSSLVKLPQVPEKMRSCVTPTDRERVETEIIKALISSYFDVVKKNYMDLVPKTIMHFLVNNFKDTLQNELVSQLYREGIMTELMRETEDIASRRKAGKQMKELLQRALEIVNEVRDFNTFK
jgi:dynamin 1-like protein